MMSDETAQDLKQKQDMLNALVAANPGAMPDMTADPQVIQAQMAEGMADADLAKRLHERGVEAPATIRSIRPTGQTDLGGGQRVELDVSVRPTAGGQYESHVRQHIAPAQLKRLAEGQHVTVKFDPDAPEAALLVDW